MVSIITPTYNAGRFIEETIKSVINQTYTDWEMIIVDDCSNDNTVELVNSYCLLDNRIKLYRLGINSGAAVARNLGLENAKGRFIAFLDSDDLWDTNKLEKQLSFMLEHNYGFSFTGYRLISESGISLNKEINIPDKIDYNDLLGNTIIGCLTVIIDKDIVGNFSMPLLRAGQDTATWLSILKKGYTAYGFNEVLASYRKVEGSVSSNKIKALKRTWNIYRNVENLGILRSSCFFAKYVKNAILKRL